MTSRRPIACLVVCATVLLGGFGSALAEGAADWAEAPGEPDPGAPAREAFARFCAACHAGPADQPVNFLDPPSGSPADAIARCAERIQFRLVLWDWPERLRPKPPMPPADWLRAEGLAPEAWAAGEARAALRTQIAGLLALTGSSTLRVEQTGSLDDRRLRPCLAAAGE